MLTLEQIKEHPYIKEFISCTDRNMQMLGLTEHGFRHTNLVAEIARNVASRLGLSEHDQELAAISAFLHDVGNFVNREFHYNWSVSMVYPVLLELKMPPADVTTVLNAIFTHDQRTFYIFNPIAAIAILADKSDVHRSRVPPKDINPTTLQQDIHTRVNYAVTHSFLRVEPEKKVIALELEIDTSVTPLMEYFEAFIDRMVHCRKAAEFLGLKFSIIMNGNQVL
jgi:metal-dependent HD superfamily phosphatase/phosphodiesterase